MDVLNVVLLATLIVNIRSEDYVITSTRLGDLRGTRRIVPDLDGTSDSSSSRVVFEYRSIPFAKPPIGNLRFEKPVQHGSWNGTLDATPYSPSCYQDLYPDDPFLKTRNVSEDCLFLNIHVPFDVQTNNSKSVMVWIHGGGYSSGQASSYDGSYLAVSGDVIVVTINYRLNVFGFFSMGDIKGNYGILDQIMALQWVKDNIDSFGGNNKAITIFGESAGAFSVGLLTVIPSNRGLFQRAILQSGAAISSLAFGKTTRLASIKVAHSLNCSQSATDYIECLKNLSASDLFMATYSIQSDTLFAIPFAPVVDGELLDHEPKKILEDAASEGYKFFRSLDVVVGTVTGESSLFLTTFIFLFPELFNITAGIPRDFFCGFIASDIVITEYNNDTRIKEAICQYYGTATDKIELSLDILDALSDFTFDIPAIKSLRTHFGGDGVRYHYVFSVPPLIPLFDDYPWWFDRAEHASDILFQFPQYALTTPYSSLASDFMTYWTHFAKFGNMDAPGLPQWNQYDISNGFYLNFNFPISSGQHLYKDRVKFWLNDIPAIDQQTSAGVIHVYQLSVILLSIIVFFI